MITTLICLLTVGALLGSHRLLGGGPDGPSRAAPELERPVRESPVPESDARSSALAAQRIPAGRRRTVFLGLLAVVAWVTYLHGFTFHGGGHFIHDYDAGHYILGSKYFSELRYDGLYGAMLHAEWEDTGHVTVSRIRDLAGGKLMAVDGAWETGRAVRERFDDARWHSFRADAASFRQAMSAHHYEDFLQDQGFNPTPFWALLGGRLASRWSAGETLILHLLCAIDGLLLILAAWVIGRSFGLRTALLATLLFCSIFGAGFHWIGGAFIRHGWFVAVVLAVCMLHTGCHGRAGVLFAVAAMLRVFPAVFMFGIVAKALWGAWQEGRLQSAYVRCIGAFCATSVGLFGWTLSAPGGLANWRWWIANLGVYVHNDGSNLVGLKRLLEKLLLGLTAAPDGWLVQTFDSLYLLLPLGVLLTIGWWARRFDDVTVTACSGAALFVLIDMAAYYYVSSVVCVLAFRHRPRILASLFGLEAVSHGLPFLVPAMDDVYLWRSLLLLYVGLYGWHALARTPFRMPTAGEYVRESTACS